MGNRATGSMRAAGGVNLETGAIFGEDFLRDLLQRSDIITSNVRSVLWLRRQWGPEIVEYIRR